MRTFEMYKSNNVAIKHGAMIAPTEKLPNNWPSWSDLMMILEVLDPSQRSGWPLLPSWPVSANQLARLSITKCLSKNPTSAKHRNTSAVWQTRLTSPGQLKPQRKSTSGFPIRPRDFGFIGSWYYGLIFLFCVLLAFFETLHFISFQNMITLTTSFWKINVSCLALKRLLLCGTSVQFFFPQRLVASRIIAVFTKKLEKFDFQINHIIWAF